MSYKPNREELAWAAGFFDGEGSVHIAYSCKRKDGSFRHYPQVSLGQSGVLAPEVLNRFQRAIGMIGKLYGPFKPAKNQKQVRFLLEFSGFAKTQAIMAMLWSWLGTVKRNKFEVVRNAYLAI